MRKCLLVPLFAFALAVAALPGAAPAQPKDDAWQKAVDKAKAYLAKTQNEDGSWGPVPQNRGITGIDVVGLIRCGVKPDEAPVAKGVKFIEGLVNEKSGHIAGNDANAGLINYTTSINIMALNAAGRSDKYKGVI
jgi:squalene-hopene/tetraprenyl-beta-curcumene cyclase